MVDTLQPLRFLTNRSEAEIDDTCGMKYWWYKKEGGKGIVPKNEAIHFLIGRETHLDLATVAEMENISPKLLQALATEILAPLTEMDRLNRGKMELLYRRLGWLVAWALYIEPRIRTDYEDIGIEKEIVLDRSPLWVATTPDRLLQHRKTRVIHYREYKTTIRADRKWQDSWRFAIQIHIGLKAAREETKEDVAFGQVVGLLKGSASFLDGHLVHPYVWGYYNRKADSWEHEYDKARGNDWEKMPIWEYPGGIVEWVQRCGQDVALAQFPHSSPVFLDDRMLSDWVSRRLARERHIAQVETCAQRNIPVRSIHFERRTRSCRPPFGDACPYLPCCWNAVVEKDPLSSGLYVARVPHHELETIGMV